MNCIILEGMSLYLFLLLIVLLLVISIVCLINTVIADKRSYTLTTELEQEQQKTQMLLKHIFRLKLIYGDFDIND